MDPKICLGLVKATEYIKNLVFVQQKSILLKCNILLPCKN